MKVTRKQLALSGSEKLMSLKTYTLAKATGAFVDIFQNIDRNASSN